MTSYFYLFTQNPWFNMYTCTNHNAFFKKSLLYDKYTVRRTKNRRIF